MDAQPPNTTRPGDACGVYSDEGNEKLAKVEKLD